MRGTVCDGGQACCAGSTWLDPLLPGAAAGGEEGGEEGDEAGAAVAAVLNGAVAGVVYRSAIAAVPDSVPFRARFLELLAPLDFPGKAALEVRWGAWGWAGLALEAD